MVKVTLVVERGYISLLFKALNLRLVATMAYDIYSWIAHTIGKFTFRGNMIPLWFSTIDYLGECKQMTINITDAEALLILAMMSEVTIERDKPLAENIKQIIYQAKSESDNDT